MRNKRDEADFQAAKAELEAVLRHNFILPQDASPWL
jgi:hypothetical protein